MKYRIVTTAEGERGLRRGGGRAREVEVSEEALRDLYRDLKASRYRQIQRTVEAHAHTLGCSRETLQRRLRERYGMTPSQIRRRAGAARPCEIESPPVMGGRVDQIESIDRTVGTVAAAADEDVLLRLLLRSARTRAADELAERLGWNSERVHAALVRLVHRGCCMQAGSRTYPVEALPLHEALPPHTAGFRTAPAFKAILPA